MTTQQMIDAFLLEYDLNGSGAVAGFEDSEIISFLNKAQKEIVEKVFINNGPNHLYSLVKEVNMQTVGTDPEEVTLNYIELPADFMFYISSKVILTRVSHPVIAVASWIRCELIDVNLIDKFINSALNNLILINPIVTVKDGKILLVIDNDTIIESDLTDQFSYRLKYLRMPLEMTQTTQDSELSEKWHQDIVNKAVLNALIVTNDTRVRQQDNSKSN
jgi:hypothetical protein